jgi:hypothetical protein
VRVGAGGTGEQRRRGGDEEEMEFLHVFTL